MVCDSDNKGEKCKNQVKFAKKKRLFEVCAFDEGGSASEKDGYG
jgi:hypothetical protein